MIRISTRVVIVLGEYAIKIPIDRRGWLQGVNEAFLWDKYRYSNQLVPVVWNWRGLIVQRRAYPLSRLKPKYVEFIKRQIPELNIRNCDLNNPENWGVYKGKVVLLDYGITDEVARMYR